MEPLDPVPGDIFLYVCCFVSDKVGLVVVSCVSYVSGITKDASSLSDIGILSKSI